jgi:hypothetical protein
MRGAWFAGPRDSPCWTDGGCTIGAGAARAGGRRGSPCGRDGGCTAGDLEAGARDPARTTLSRTKSFESQRVGEGDEGRVERLLQMRVSLLSMGGFTAVTGCSKDCIS